ncbi:hypothetical protein [Arthrobacter rhombi]|uniref:hypothetical protein n=1 Tax=Arthrobacter rhombi TaxID=71253 RepID=UPI001177F47F|nr:hypothetical protein [Arthrobacter rhombi]
MNRPDDPLVISVQGSMKLDQPTLAAIRSGELESEGAFACFYATSKALSPRAMAQDLFEAHEGFWGFDGNLQTDRLKGELGRFQTGIPTRGRTALPVPLLVHSASQAVGQLGEYEFSGLRVQAPLSAHVIGWEAIQVLLDQFAATAEVSKLRTATARLFSASPSKKWQTKGAEWFNKTHLEPFVASGISSETPDIEFDGRWSLSTPETSERATFTTPEWSPSAAANMVMFMLEAARAAGIKETVIVDVQLG